MPSTDGLLAPVARFFTRINADDVDALDGFLTEDISYQPIVPHPAVSGRGAVIEALWTSITEAQRVRWGVPCGLVTGDRLRTTSAQRQKAPRGASGKPSGCPSSLIELIPVTLRVTLLRVIQSFAASDTEKLFNGRRVAKYGPDLTTRALQKLLMINAANTLKDLSMPPGNRLEPLTGDRKGQHSIRINDQYRICFTWSTAGPEQVEIIHYH
jgi:proteic killer suppression protein